MTDKQGSTLSQQVDLRTWKVIKSKVLNVNDQNVYDTINFDEHLVCVESDTISESTGCLNYLKFKNVNGLLIKTEKNKEKLFAKIVKNLNHRLRDKPEFFIQIFIKSCKKSKIYLKTRKMEMFEEVFVEDDENDFKKGLDNSEKNLNVEYFCEIMKYLNMPIDELTFEDIFNVFQLKNDYECIINFLKCIKDDFLIRIFWSFNIKLPNCYYRDAISTNNFNDIFNALKCVHLKEFSEEFVETLLNNKHCEEILTLMVQKNYLNSIKGLLKHQELIVLYIKFNIWSKIRKISLENHSFEVHFELQRIENIFYQEYDEITSKNTSEAIEILHKNIEAKNLNEIKTFVKDYPDFKFCFDKSQICALEKSIDCKSFEIYAYLRSEDFIPYKKDIFDLKLKELTPEEFEEINKFNLQNVKSHDDDFIHILYSKCDLFSCHGQFSSSEIWEMHEILAKLEGVRWIMKNASKSEIQIVFDLRTVGINVIDLTQNELSCGVAFNETQKLFVGRNVNKLERLGTFAHELTHLVMFIIYENDSHPYCKYDLERKAKWDGIVEKYVIFHKDPSNYEKFNKIIARAFAYQPHKIGIELAVKVPELLAYFYENPDLTNEIRENYPEVFDYFYELVLSDLRIPFAYEMIKLNQDLELFKEIEDSKIKLKTDIESKILNLPKNTSRRIIVTSNVFQLTLSQIVNELKDLPGNKLNLKVRNIYLDLQKLDQEHIKKEFENLLSNADIDRVITKIKNFDKEKLSFIERLKAETLCIVVPFDSSCTQLVENFKFTLNPEPINYTWSDLTLESKDFILKKHVKFQSKVLQVSELLANHNESISPDILSILSSNEKIQVNSYLKPKELDNFIPRSIQTKNRNNIDVSYELDDFLDMSVDTDRYINVVLISDMAGSGKTTLLKKITEILTSKFPTHWISLISLRDHIKVLSQDINESFVDFLAKILNLDAFGKEIFTQKYLQGKAKILFDAFDEISPIAKNNTLKLIKKFEFFQENQMFLTTRTHFEHELETELNIASHKLKILEDYEQVEYLTQLWSNSHPDLSFINACSNSLVIKIAEVIFTSSSVIGLPLIVIGLAKVFKDKINENFEAEIENLDITQIYRIIIEKSLDVLHAKFPEKTEENLKKLKGLLQAHVYFSIDLIFGEGSSNQLGLVHDDDTWPLEEVSRGGIFKSVSEEKSELNHLTYADYFIAGYLFDFIKNSKKPSTAQLELLTQNLSDEKFKITRMFLNNMLEKVDNVKNLKILTSRSSSEKFCKTIDCNIGHEITKNIIKEVLLSVYNLFLELIRNDTTFFMNALEYRLVNDDNKTILMHLLPLARNVIQFENILDIIFDFYSENVFGDFLMKTDKLMNLIFHHFSHDCHNANIFRAFWKKIKSLNLTNEQIEKIYFYENNNNETFFGTAFSFGFNYFGEFDEYLNISRELKIRKKRNEFLYETIINELFEEKLREMLNKLDKNSFLLLFHYDFLFHFFK